RGGNPRRDGGPQAPAQGDGGCARQFLSRRSAAAHVSPVGRQGGQGAVRGAVGQFREGVRRTERPEGAPHFIAEDGVRGARQGTRRIRSAACQDVRAA